LGLLDIVETLVDWATFDHEMELLDLVSVATVDLMDEMVEMVALMNSKRNHYNS
jgi:hypothetical protein